MFCPKCGQQQIAEEVRFCSRCGLPLGAVTSLVANDGQVISPVGGIGAAVAKRCAAKTKGTRRGVKLMFISLVLLPIFFGMAVAADHPGPLLVALTIFLVGFFLMLYARLFAEDAAPALNPAALRPPALFAPADDFARRDALPHAQSIPAAHVYGAPQTAEIAQTPGSVTEHTTRLLEHD